MAEFENEDTLKRMQAIQRGAPFRILYPSDIHNIIEALEKVVGEQNAER